MSDILGFILFLIASIMKLILSPFLYFWGFYKSAKDKKLGDYHNEIAKSFDRVGNVLGQYFFNDCLIVKDGYKFGNGKETISSVEGKNKIKGTFRMLGAFLAKILNLIQKNHVEKAIDDKV